MIAVVSDVHGNLPALEAVLADARARGAIALWNLGDSVYGPLWPRETYELLRAPGLWALHLRGNQDRVLGEADASYTYNRSLAFSRAQLGPDAIAWLMALPGVARAEDAFLCHGTPASDEQYFFERVTSAGAVELREAADLAARCAPVQARLFACGHSHLPRAVRVRPDLLAFNPGSVGLPAYADELPAPHAMESGSPHARYALVDGPRVELVAVAYDHERAAARAEANGRPDWARALRTGRA